MDRCVSRRGLDAAEEPRQRALANLTRAIQPTRRFPANVFTADWRECYFFDSDRMFIGAFAGNVRTLLELEGGVCACMCDVYGTERGDPPERRCLFIDPQGDNELYLSYLRQPRGPDVIEWSYGLNNLACTSDVGRWAIYCEGQSEMAVIAFHERGIAKTFAPALARLEAYPIREAIEREISHVFSLKHMLPTFREMLVKEYGTGKRDDSELP